jgi:hypothetical protein|tara:strand:- start:15220 stop:15372 length:153 start_codon:yes stop_codon:yes gene_type:complete
MKLDIQEVYFLSQCASNATIKASDAEIVYKAIQKLEKELSRLEKLEASKD